MTGSEVVAESILAVVGWNTCASARAFGSETTVTGDGDLNKGSTGGVIGVAVGSVPLVTNLSICGTNNGGRPSVLRSPGSVGC